MNVDSQSSGCKETYGWSKIKVHLDWPPPSPRLEDGPHLSSGVAVCSLPCHLLLLLALLERGDLVWSFLGVSLMETLGPLRINNIHSFWQGQSGRANWPLCLTRGSLDFPGGPVVKGPCFHCRMNLRAPKLCGVAKNKVAFRPNFLKSGCTLDLSGGMPGFYPDISHLIT